MAAVCRAADESLWVTADLARWSETEPDDGPHQEFDDDGAFYVELHGVVAEAGPMPPGATAAYVRDVFGEYHAATVGAGVWLAVLPRGVRFRASTTLFRDAGGSVVAPPHPPAARREPLSEARERCPACDGEEWDLLSQAGHGWPNDLAACRRCGHRVYASPAPSWLPEELPALPPWLARAGALAGRAVLAGFQAWGTRGLRSAQFPVYGLGPGWKGARFLAGWGGGVLSPPTTIELAHGDPGAERGPLVVVETTSEDTHDPEWLPPARCVEEDLFTALEEADPDGDEVPAGADHAAALRASLRNDERERALARRVLTATRRARAIPVDGEPVEFAELDAGDLWAAAARVGDVDVSLLGREVPPESIELIRVEDVSAYAVKREE